MKLSNAERDMLVAELRRIALRLAGAPAHTQELAKADLRRRQSGPISYDRDANHYPHQVGGLEQTCTSTARDIEAVIRRLGGGS